ncbi:MAG: hypothetical protein ABJG47_06590 [Ekhidna sp.]
MKSILFSLTIILSTGLFAQSVTLDNIDLDEVSAVAFNLPNDATVKIEGIGAALDHDWQIAVYYGWIVDSETQKVVWHLFDFMDDNDVEVDGEFDFADKVNLSKGHYELYYASGKTNYDRYNNNHAWSVNSFDDVVKKVFNSRSNRKFRHSVAEEAFIRVSSQSLSRTNIYDLIDEKIEGSIFSFTRTEDDDSMKKGFSLKADTDLKIYSIGEGDRDESYDYLVIYDAASREPVFEMNYRDAEFAGGAKKNILIDEVISFKKGDYIAQYVSDDSHSFEKWNALPPDNPFFWGATAWPASPEDAKNVIPFREPKIATPILDLIKVRDDELVSRGLSVKADMDVRVICLGEGNDDLVDYGWIVNANTREKVWEMKEYKTEHAGGAEKNRRVSEIISLEKGEYIVYYSTDGSHSYEEWNSTPPREASQWGITLLATNEADFSKVETFDPRDFVSKNTIAEILMVGDDERISETFSLNQTTRVRIIALGEGDNDDMYDYAYLRDEDGQRIWKMEYRDSDHAGGARKNRYVSETLTLEKGEYRLTYRSDGSHSYKRWNSSPPSDQEMWGVSIRKEE